MLGLLILFELLQMDSTFRAISVPLCDELRLPESRTLLA